MSLHYFCSVTYDTLQFMNSESVNKIQVQILRQLSKGGGRRFSEINTGDVPTDHFSYHLKQLIKYGFVEKSADNLYSLSAYGKTRSIMLYPNSNGFIEQGFMAVRIVVTKKVGKTLKYLIQERIVEPYKGVYGTPGEKILYGEKLSEAADRALKVQTGLTCPLELKGMIHMFDELSGEIMQDKYFFIFSGSEPNGELIASGRSGKNIWISKDELIKSPKLISGGKEILEIAASSHYRVEEITASVSRY